MMPQKNFQIYLMIIIFLITKILFFDRCLTTPQNNQFDPYVIYSAKCSDKFYEKRDKMQVSFGLSPFYQQTHYARDGHGHKVPLNAMQGKWNMLAPFFNVADLTPKTFNQINYPNLYSSKQALNIGGIDYSNVKNYDPNTMYDEVTFNSIKCDYEKLGLRGQIIFDSGFGIGLKVKTGVVDYKSTGSLYATNPNNDSEATTRKKELYNALLSDASSSGIFKDLGLDVKEDRETTFEDTHIELYFQIPFEFKDEGETVVIFSPYLSVGGWLSTGQEKDYNKFYSLPTGNNGHYGVTIEGSLNFDFPGTIQISVGGGVNICDSHEYSFFRFISNVYQEGFSPWATKVDEDPGDTWYFNASFKAANFIKDLSFYFDYVYTYHEKDEITIQESSVKRKAYFESELSDFLNKTSWKDQKVNAGLSYRISQNLAFGASIQAHISGFRVAKETTEMGYIELTF